MWLIVLLLICGRGSWELHALLKAAKVPQEKSIALIGGLLLIGGTWFQERHTQAGESSALEWSILFLVVTVTWWSQFRRPYNTHSLETIAGTLLGIMYIPFLFNFFTKLLVGWEKSDGRLIVLYLIVIVKCTDIGAYFVGSKFGRHKLFPRISPAKTWEGCVGGILSGMIVSLSWYLCTRGDFFVVSMTIVDALILGVCLPVIGIVGDLTESLLKRSAAVKDSGKIIKGMGGVLDVIDSLLFAGPAMYIYTHLFLEKI